MAQALLRGRLLTPSSSPLTMDPAQAQRFCLISSSRSKCRPMPLTSSLVVRSPASLTDSTLSLAVAATLLATPGLTLAVSGIARLARKPPLPC